MVMEMKALITGASSGIGEEMAKVLASRGWDLIVVARRESLLLELKEELAGCDVKVCVCDLSQVSQVKALCKTLKDEPIEMVINNAGFGDLGYFDETDEETLELGLFWLVASLSTKLLEDEELGFPP